MIPIPDRKIQLRLRERKNMEQSCEAQADEQGMQEEKQGKKRDGQQCED